nr:reverse transcriptase domain-containing protein [Tanacetum cinerariifolium]
MDTIKFKAPPPMTGPAENQNKNKFCEFHGDKGHSTDERIHLRRKIEEAVKSGQLSLLASSKNKKPNDSGNNPLLGFSGEISWPLGKISLMVNLGDEEHSTSALMNFMVVRSSSPYNGIIGRLGLKKIQAVPSTTHGMLKFTVEGEIATIRSSTVMPAECRMIAEAHDTLLPRETTSQKESK